MVPNTTQQPIEGATSQQVEVRMTCAQRMSALLAKFGVMKEPRYFFLRNAPELRICFDAAIVKGASPVLDNYIQNKVGTIYLSPGMANLSLEYFSMLLEFIYTKNVASFDGGLEDWIGLMEMGQLFRVQGLSAFCEDRIEDWKNTMVIEPPSSYYETDDSSSSVGGSTRCDWVMLDEVAIPEKAGSSSGLKQKMVNDITTQLTKGLGAGGMAEMKRQVLSKVVTALKEEIIEKHKEELMQKVMDKWSHEAAAILVKQIKDSVMDELVEEMRNGKF